MSQSGICTGSSVSPCVSVVANVSISPYPSVSPPAVYVNPADIAGLSFWLDASDQSTLNLTGLTITEWRDKGPLGIAFSNATVPGLEPVLNPPNSGVDDFPLQSVLVSAAVGLATLRAPAFTLPTGDSTSLFVTSIGVLGGAYKNAAIGGAIIVPGNLTRLPCIDSDTVFFQINNGGVGRASFGPVTTTGRCVTVVAHDAALSILTCTQNGVALPQTGAVAPIPATATNFVAMQPGGPSVGRGSFAEYLHYDRVLNPTEMSLLRNYLASKWGV